MKKGTLVLYLSQYKSIEKLSLEDKGRLLDSLFYYLENDNEPDDMSPIVSIAFSFIKNRVDLDTEKYIEKCRKNRENIRKRYERIRSYTKATDNDNDNDNDKDKEKDNDKDITITTDVVNSKKELSINIDNKKEEKTSAFSDENALPKKEKKIISYASIVNEFNSRFTGRLATVKTLTESRKTAIRARLTEHGTDSWKELFDKVDESDFLMGRNDRNWRADFDWLFKPSNYCKVIENNYGNSKNIGTTAGRKGSGKFGHTIDPPKSYTF